MLCGDDHIVNVSQIKHLDGRHKPAATPRVGRGYRDLVLASEACRIDAMRRTAKTGHEEISPSFRVDGQVVYLDKG
jgi:hypothetical protein